MLLGWVSLYSPNFSARNAKQHVTVRILILLNRWTLWHCKSMRVHFNHTARFFPLNGGFSNHSSKEEDLRAFLNGVVHCWGENGEIQELLQEMKRYMPHPSTLSREWSRLRELGRWVYYLLLGFWIFKMDGSVHDDQGKNDVSESLELQITTLQ